MGRVAKTVFGAVVTAVAVAAWSAQVSAHVTINTFGDVSQGSFAKIGFSVPNERDDAGTVKLSVQLPQDHPLAFISVQPMPGWDIATTTRTLDEPIEGEGDSISEVADTITWTATGDTQIEPGQFELFWISAGQMPTDVTELAFPAIQTYSSGEEVSWIDPVVEGEPEPERPAPTVELVAASAGAEEEATATTVPVGDEEDDDDSNALSIVALAVGAAGLAIGVIAFATARRRPAAGTG